MKVLICGGRNYSDQCLVFHQLDQIHASKSITELIHGDARGADRLGREWAKQMNVPERAFPASWRRYGKAAGAIRNQQMLDQGKPDLVIAFPDPQSRGTWDMVRRAQNADLEIIIT